MTIVKQVDQLQEVTVSTNMKCSSCLEKLRPTLDQTSEIVKWEADLSNGLKTVTAKMQGNTPREKLVEAVKEAGFEAKIIENQGVIKDDSQEGQGQSTNEKQVFKISNYKPLILVVFYVCGAAAILTSAQEAGWVWENFLRFFMGFFFLGFAFFKLLDVSKFADAFATYDIVAKRSRLYALIYPYLEFSLGTAFILGWFPALVNTLTVVVMGVGSIGVLKTVRKRQAIQCACLGTVFNLPMSAVTIIENSTMILMALFMLFRDL
jgi:cation transport ATPase|tara:strand:- start:1772 stop:2563 length:792 start_codon:yes stop_codon:yes gene_type:complete